MKQNIYVSNESVQQRRPGFLELILLAECQISRIFTYFRAFGSGGILIVGKQSETQQLAWIWLLLGITSMSLLTWFNGRPEAAGLLQVPWDKVAHGLVFGGLSLSFGLSAGGRRRGLVFLFMVAFAAFDELRQRFLPGRTVSIEDFATDVLAIISALWVILPRLPGRSRQR